MIKRRIFARLKEHLPRDQMTILIGPRQVGKTYLMRALQQQLETEGTKTVWLSLDSEEDKRRFSSQSALLSYIELQVGMEKTVVFIDEIQRKEDAGLFLKGIYDMGSPYKFVVSGSGSLELKAKIPESMAGRKQLFTVEPVSFEEFINYKTNYQYEDKLADFFALEEGKTTRLLSEYLVFGGYPRVVLAETASLKQSEMQEIYRSYVDRDIHDLLHLAKSDAFANLLKVIASQIGSLVNVSELASTLTIDEKTIKQYLFYLEQTFIIKKVTPYFRNTRKEITKAPVYYFADIGFRNWLLGLFGLPEIPAPLSGHLFENVVFNTLTNKLELTPTQIHFWRTRDQAEVDFVLEKGMEVLPVEAKYTKLSNLEVPRSLRNFLARYKPANGYVVHIGNKEDKQTIENTAVQLLPYYKLVLQSPL
ncbi:ATP-binding protein [Candidatus Roizmanbacteria bacterium]|nr:ATP-binding protein [Candidatus Roizmanbacteria bacterium]